MRVSSPIHRYTRVTRVNDLIRVVTLHATVMASGSLPYLMGCGGNRTPKVNLYLMHLKRL